MSQTYSDILSIIDDNCNTDTSSFSVASKTRYVNLGIDFILLSLFGSGAGGTWQLDDSNHTDYPIITTNIVSGQRDYAFTTDEDGNVILDIYKVMAKQSSSGVYVELLPVDQQSGNTPLTMTDGNNTAGVPLYYDKTANGIFLDLVPNYNATNGLKVFINRESTYFTVSDTTKKWGFTGLWHEYLIVYACYQYARANGLSNQEAFKRDLRELEEKIKQHAGFRQRDVKRVMKPMYQNNH